jgi:predicted O-methyltransferase YrrM|tara:strand:- start:240 stop:959 length:720 start_codon:yes stop_codon:yes gene_type:complete
MDKKIKTTSLKDFFQRISYNWEKDKQLLSEILKLSKTRVNYSINEFTLSWGMEQTFFIKACCESIGCKNFFEIGTGRGTASYAVSLIPHIEKVVTVDIIPHTQKQNTAINFKPAVVSNRDLYEMVSLEEKEKITFHHVNDYQFILENYNSFFDIAFIDGCHEDYDIIMNDFEIVSRIIKNGGWIIWDDYDPNKFEVKNVVTEIVKKYKLKCELIEFRGHLFGEKAPEKQAGEIIMKFIK